jgi:hypothetical protein
MLAQVYLCVGQVMVPFELDDLMIKLSFIRRVGHPSILRWLSHSKM